jgi:hypothetical protein
MEFVSKRRAGAAARKLLESTDTARQVGCDAETRMQVEGINVGLQRPERAFDPAQAPPDV